jgi:hypothetical protein
MHLLWQLLYLSCMCCLFVSFLPKLVFFLSLSCLHPFFVMLVITHIFLCSWSVQFSSWPGIQHIHFDNSVCPAAGPTVAFLTMIMQVLWTNVLILVFLLFSLLPLPSHLLLDVWVLNVTFIACKNILVTKFSRHYCFSLTVIHAVSMLISWTIHEILTL